MKTKDVIALWILLLWILWTATKLPFLGHDEFSRPITTILWDAAVAVIVGVSGLFLFFRFVNMQGDLQRYEAEEERILKELETRREIEAEEKRRSQE